MSESMDLLTNMKERMAEFSKGQRAIARYIISNYDKASYMTAAALGKNAGVSESTVVRFAYEMGFAGYPEFQQAMADYVTGRLNMVKRLEIATDEMDPNEIADFVMANDIENIKNSWEHIDRNALNEAVESIINAEKIYIVGIRSSGALAELLAFYLKLVRDNVVMINNNGSTEVFEQMLHVGSRDVVIGISFPRYSMRTIKAMEFANDRNARVIAITDNKHSPINLYSSCNLFAHSNMSSVVESFSAAVSLINVLIVSIYMKKKERVLDNIKMLEEVWEQYQNEEPDEIDLFDQEKVKNFD